MYCAPNKKFDQVINTCFELDDLIDIAKAYNFFRKSVCLKKTCIKFTKIDTTLQKQDLYKEIQNRLLGMQEYKWIDMDFIKSLDKNTRDKLQFFIFKPVPINTSKSWFNTNNINEILQQYQLYINEKNGENYFKYMGCHPSDISRLYPFNWTELQTKYKCISIIFNIDTHKKPGSHWVCCFIDNVTKSVNYFDSLGHQPNKYIREFFIHFEENYTFKINKIAFQDKSSLCGLYACWFTIMKLNNKTFEEIQQLNVSDKFMYKYLKSVFRPK